MKGNLLFSPNELNLACFWLNITTIFAPWRMPAQMNHTLQVHADQVQFGLGNYQSMETKERSEKTEPERSMSSENKRTLVVLRVSAESLTTKNQLHAMRDEIAKLPVKPTIRHITGTNWRKSIPEMEALLDEIKQDRWSEVWFLRVCRAGRNHKFDVTLWELCVSHGVNLRFIANNLSTLRNQDRLMFNMLSSVADWERVVHADRTKEGIARYRAENTARKVKDEFGGSKPGRIIGKTRDAIPAILGLASLGFSHRKIAAQLHHNPKTILRILNLPIEELRSLTGNSKLQDWRPAGK